MLKSTIPKQNQSVLIPFVCVIRVPVFLLANFKAYSYRLRHFSFPAIRHFPGAPPNIPPPAWYAG